MSNRFKNVNGEKIQLTDEEESVRDTEETAWEERKPAKALRGLRAKRDSLLVFCDWTQAADSPLSDEVIATWATYRSALRDLPANTSDPFDITWPDAP